MEPNAAVAKVREMIAENPALAEDFKAAWNRVCDKIEARALAKRPKPRVFEVYHQTEVARIALLTAIAEGKSLEASEAVALTRVHLA